MLHYGVDNIRKSKDYYEKLHIDMLNKYGAKSVPNLHGNINPFGVKTLSPEDKLKRFSNLKISGAKWWESLTDEQKTEIIQKRTRKLLCYYNSSLEVKIKQGLENLNISFKSQYWISRRSYDFKLKDFNTLIEVQGDFWHANPKKYLSTDILNFPSGKTLANDIWAKDTYKKELAEQYGYKIVYIWENELVGMTQPEIMKLILDKLYENSEH